MLCTFIRTYLCTYASTPTKITEEDEAAVAKLLPHAWETSLTQGGRPQEGYEIVELAGLNTRGGLLEGMWLIARGV